MGEAERDEPPQRWDTGRVEAFSDGVFAIAITLLILEIDVQGAALVRAQAPDAVLILLTPPSMEALEARLRGRARLGFILPSVVVPSETTRPESPIGPSAGFDIKTVDPETFRAKESFP